MSTSNSVQELLKNCPYDTIYEPIPIEILRKLFTDYTNYIHLYIMSEVLKLPNIKIITDRLLKNQEEIGKFFVEYIGIKKSKKLIELLKEHIMFIFKILKASILNMPVKVITHDLIKNSHKISKFIYKINPDVLSIDEIKIHFDQNIEYILTLSKMYIDGKYKKTIEVYDCYYNHMLIFSDMLSLLI